MNKVKNHVIRKLNWIQYVTACVFDFCHKFDILLLVWCQFRCSVHWMVHIKLFRYICLTMKLLQLTEKNGSHLHQKILMLNLVCIYEYRYWYSNSFGLLCYIWNVQNKYYDTIRFFSFWWFNKMFILWKI